MFIYNTLITAISYNLQKYHISFRFKLKWQKKQPITVKVNIVYNIYSILIDNLIERKNIHDTWVVSCVIDL